MEDDHDDGESKKGSDRDDGDEVDDEEEEYNFRVFFRKEEIQTTNEM